MLSDRSFLFVCFSLFLLRTLFFSFFRDGERNFKKKKKGIVWLGEKPKIGSVCVDLL